MSMSSVFPRKSTKEKISKFKSVSKSGASIRKSVRQIVPNMPAKRKSKHKPKQELQDVNLVTASQRTRICNEYDAKMKKLRVDWLKRMEKSEIAFSKEVIHTDRMLKVKCKENKRRLWKRMKESGKSASDIRKRVSKEKATLIVESRRNIKIKREANLVQQLSEEKEYYTKRCAEALELVNMVSNIEAHALNTIGNQRQRKAGLNERRTESSHELRFIVKSHYAATIKEIEDETIRLEKRERKREHDAKILKQKKDAKQTIKAKTKDSDVTSNPTSRQQENCNRLKPMCEDSTHRTKLNEFSARPSDNCQQDVICSVTNSQILTTPTFSTHLNEAPSSTSWMSKYRAPSESMKGVQTEPSTLVSIPSKFGTKKWVNLNAATDIDEQSSSQPTMAFPVRTRTSVGSGMVTGEGTGANTVGKIDASIRPQRGVQLGEIGKQPSLGGRNLSCGQQNAVIFEVYNQVVPKSNVNTNTKHVYVRTGMREGAGLDAHQQVQVPTKTGPSALRHGKQQQARTLSNPRSQHMRSNLVEGQRFQQITKPEGISVMDGSKRSNNDTQLQGRPNLSLINDSKEYEKKSPGKPNIRNDPTEHSFEVPLHSQQPANRHNESDSRQSQPKNERRSRHKRN
eukprot:CFRG4106T1